MVLQLSDITLSSSAFSDGEAIPKRYSAEGDNVSPPLEWRNPPDGTQSYVILCHDPDAPFIEPGQYGFVHWTLYNIPASVSSIREGNGDKYTEGQTDFGESAYGGPLPPPGHGPHRYYFVLFALGRDLELPANLLMTELLEHIAPHVLGINRLVGIYERHK